MEDKRQQLPEASDVPEQSSLESPIHGQIKGKVLTRSQRKWPRILQGSSRQGSPERC